MLARVNELNPASMDLVKTDLAGDLCHEPTKATVITRTCSVEGLQKPVILLTRCEYRIYRTHWGSIHYADPHPPTTEQLFCCFAWGDLCDGVFAIGETTLVMV